MIKHHPNQQLLTDFAAGTLTPSVSVAVSIHAEMCACCQKAINDATEKLAKQCFSEPDTDTANFDDMLEMITADSSKDMVSISEPRFINKGANQFKLPSALNQLQLGDWQTIGSLSRSRVNLDDGSIHSSVLHIDAKGEVPSHTHNGYEITLMLDGSFSDEMGEYHKGDFILLDGEHNHTPYTEDGCICYTVVSDALHFTSGLSRLLNPIGKLIY